MRTKNSIKNIFAALLSNMTTIIVGLIAQKIFIQILGNEYLGLNSLFSNIISMLGIVEMGLGSAIIYSLYKPIANNNIEQIKSLMNFYKKSYKRVGIIVSLLGIILLPFLQYLVNFESVSIDVHIYIVYILFLLDSVCSYFLSYKRSILYAQQENRIINLIHVGYTIIMNIAQLVILQITKNYYYYLIIKIIMRILENIIITIIADSKYSYLKDKKIKKLDKNIELDIQRKVKALFFHKIGGFAVNGTDNIIISKFLGLTCVGLYSNYYFIINAVQTVFGQIIQATTASVGNLLVTENSEKCYEVFKKIRFLNYWIATFSSIAVLVLMENFIALWLGKEFVLSTGVLIILIFNLYQKLMRNSYLVFKEAAGVFYEDRYIPVVEALLNIIFSIIGCYLCGLAGVFIGTVISGLVLWLYSYPKYVYKKLFNRKYINYFIETIGYIVLFIIIALITFFLAKNINFDNLLIELLVNIILSIVIPNVILIILFFKNDNFKYYKNLIRRNL